MTRVLGIQGERARAHRIGEQKETDAELGVGEQRAGNSLNFDPAALDRTGKDKAVPALMIELSNCRPPAVYDTLLPLIVGLGQTLRRLWSTMPPMTYTSAGLNTSSVSSDSDVR